MQTIPRFLHGIGQAVLEAILIPTLHLVQLLRWQVQSEVAALRHRAEHQTEPELAAYSLSIGVVLGIEQVAQVVVRCTYQSRVVLDELVNHLEEGIPAGVGLGLVVKEQASRHQPRTFVGPRQRLGIVPEPTGCSVVSDCLALMGTSHQVLANLSGILNCGGVVSHIVGSALVQLVGSPDRDVQFSQYGG